MSTLNIRELLMDIRDLLLGGGDSLTILTATTESISAGATKDINIDLGDTNRLSIFRVKVVASASTDFDVLFFPTDGYVSKTEDYNNENNNLKLNEQFITPLLYEDEDASNELHLRIVNTDTVNSSTFTYHIYCMKI